MKCPRDQAPLTLQDGNHAPLGCELCNGSFIQDDQIFELVEARFHDIHAFQQLSCPVCKANMAPKHFDHGNLELDVCRQCRGIWFDGSERKALNQSLKRLKRRNTRAAPIAGKVQEKKQNSASASSTMPDPNSATTEPKTRYEDYQDMSKVRGESTGAEVLLQLFLDLPIKRNLPAFRAPLVTYALIGICILTLVQALLRTGQPYFQSWVFYSQDPISSTLLLSMFAHADWLHLFFNMWFLYAVGENVEDLLGRVKYLLFYLTCGIAATLSFTIFGNVGGAVGASGAISGVMGAYLVFFPRSCFGVRVLYFWELEVPCWLLFLIYFGIDALLLGRADGIAHSAHLGGFVLGLALALVYRHTRLS